jgi:hypothetical protein
MSGCGGRHEHAMHELLRRNFTLTPSLIVPPPTQRYLQRCSQGTSLTGDHVCRIHHQTHLCTHNVAAHGAQTHAYAQSACCDTPVYYESRPHRTWITEHGLSVDKHCPAGCGALMYPRPPRPFTDISTSCIIMRSAGQRTRSQVETSDKVAAEHVRPR